MSRTRKEHIDWCKARALQELDRDGPMAAVGSMLSDLTKHPETELFIKGPLGALAAADGLLFASKDPKAARHWVEGFN